MGAAGTRRRGNAADRKGRSSVLPGDVDGLCRAPLPRSALPSSDSTDTAPAATPAMLLQSCSHSLVIPPHTWTISIVPVAPLSTFAANGLFQHVRSSRPSSHLQARPSLRSPAPLTLRPTLHSFPRLRSLRDDRHHSTDGYQRR
jgi:hypothetical protein